MPEAISGNMLCIFCCCFFSFFCLMSSRTAQSFSSAVSQQYRYAIRDEDFANKKGSLAAHVEGFF